MTTAPTPITILAEASPIDGDTDGRTLRRRRNRDAVIESLISLIREGDLDPTVAKIADRAAVSHRSIFRYFEDLDDLARTAIQTAVVHALPLGTIADAGKGTLEHRIDQVVDARIRILSYSHQLMRVATARATSLTDVDDGLATVARSFRDQLRDQFAPELQALEAEQTEQLVAVLASMLSFPGFDHQRRLLDRSIEEISEAWRFTLRMLFR